MKYDVFISYSRKDTATADQICAAFDKVGISYFIDRQGIGGGFEFPDILAEAILDSQLILFLASENAYESKYINAELTFAFNEKPKNTILPYIIDGSQLPNSMKLICSSMNWRVKSEHPIEPVLVDDVLAMLGREKVAAKREQERVKQEQIIKQQRLDEEREARERLARAAELERIAREKAESERLAREKAREQQRLEQERAERERLAKERAEAEERARQAELERIAQEKAERERIEDVVRLSGKGRNGIYRVGDYYDDGTKRGVVFEVDKSGRHGKIVSIVLVWDDIHTRMSWAKSPVWGKDYAKEHLGLLDKHDGWQNQQKVMQIKDWRKHYPAFAFCADLGEGWYLPAIEELLVFIREGSVRDAVSKTLEAKKSRLNDGTAYWSSTEYPEDIRSKNGYYSAMCATSKGVLHRDSFFSSTKNYNKLVRAITTF